MISGGSRYGRKGIGLGFDGGEGMMEETELEEGEAYSYDNNDWNVSSIDPDVSLSYLDEKLHNVLGHFQKDFEGGVSAENLGSRFGGYGSFLPANQSSPSWSHPRIPPESNNNSRQVWSHPRTPPESNNNSRQVSPNNLLAESGRQTLLGSSSTSLSGRLAASSARSKAVSALTGPKFKRERNSSQPITQSEESNSKSEKVKKPRNDSDPKSLKLRIKVGAKNLSTQKNAEIYSGLGLDVSPSSSLDGSPINREGISRDLQVSPDESPTSILQIMTSHPMRDMLLLSPLSDELISLNENDKLWGKSGSKGKKKGMFESLALENGTHYANGNEARKLKTYDKSSSAKGKGYDNHNGSALLSKKEIDVDGLACEELVSKALKLPLLSNPYPNAADPPKDAEKTIDSSKTATKGKTKEASSEWASKKSLLPGTAIDTNSVEGSGVKFSSSRITMEMKETDRNDHNSGYLKKEGHNKEESSNNGQSKDGNVQNADAASPLKQSSRQRSSSNNEDGMKLAPEKELFASRDTMKPKGSQFHNAQSTEALKESSVPHSFIASKGTKTSSSSILLSKSDSEDMKKNLTRDRYKEFFGDVELELEDAETGLEQIHPKEMLQGSDSVSKKRFERNSSLKEKVNGRKTEKLFASAEYPRFASNGAPHAICESNLSAPPGAGAPVVKEDWVCCDKCQTWRILPLGTDPDSLPKKWVCRLQTWLPGMNRCGISEEETTKALRALYQVPMSGATAPASDKQFSQHEYPGGALSGPTPIDTMHAGLEHQKAGIQAVDAGGKKIHVSKGVSSATRQEGLLSSNGVKRNHHGTPNSRSSNDGTNFLTDENGHQLVGLPSSSIIEKQRHKQKEKKKLLENYPDGDIKKSKMKNMSEMGLDGSTAKKVRRDDVHYGDDPIGAKPGQSSSTNLSNSGSERARDKYKYKKPKADSLKNLALAKNPESHSVDGSIQKCDSKDSLKRKWSECLNPETQPPRDIVEETCDNGRRKEKKARVSKSVEKGSSRSRASVETDGKSRGKKGERGRQDLDSTVSQHSADAEDSSKRDLSALQPSVAATSSSSKVSGSHKNRTSLQEPKSSPVESVSSSPLRISDKDMSSATKRNPKIKTEHKKANSITGSTPRRSSYGEIGRSSNHSGMIKKEESSNGKHHEMESSELDYQEKDVHDVSGATIKAKITGSDFATHQDTDVTADPLGQANQYAFRTENLDQGLNNGKRNINQFHNSGSTSKDEKVLFSEHKEKNRTVRSDSGKCKIKDLDISNESPDQRIDEGKLTSGRNKFEDKSGASSDRLQQDSKKDSFGKLLNENVKGDIQSKFGDGAEVKLDIMSGLDKRQAAPTDRDNGRSSRKLVSDRTQKIEALEKGKSHLTSPSIRGQNETVQSSQPVPAFKRKGVANLLAVDAFEGEMLNASRQGKKSESHPGNTPNSLPQSTPPALKVRDPVARSPIRKDSASQAAVNAIKEATNLKHLADRLKNSGSSESTSLYFQATLKFLHGASLLESCNDSAKHSEMNQSSQIYSSTAKLCEFVAHEYERLKDMAAVSLAYKCMEVAYLRVVYFSNFNANRYRNELQTALQIFPPGESPSSSASDVDNLNNTTVVDKVALAKGVASPQVAGTHVVSARNRASFTRLFNFAQEVNLAMEASRKSRVAFAAAYPGHIDTECKVPALSVKKALDFNFHDVDNLLRLVRIAMEDISR